MKDFIKITKDCEELRESLRTINSSIQPIIDGYENQIVDFVKENLDKLIFIYLEDSEYLKTQEEMDKAVAQFKLSLCEKYANFHIHIHPDYISFILTRTFYDDPFISYQLPSVFFTNYEDYLAEDRYLKRCYERRK